MHQFNIISAVILFAAFAVEFILILLHHPAKNLVKDIKANFVLGICIILAGIFEKGVSFTWFSFVYDLALIRPPTSVGLWIAAFFSCDFIHYVYHWIGHKTRLFWAAHVTHHSSQYFNLSTGLRTNFIHLFYRFIFWSPLCFLGIPPQMVLLFESLSAIQNFLVHTEKIGKLGGLDWWFNTPSNHRVHHGSNPQYVDRNLGGILMIYDHLFGTYAREGAAPVYGIVHNINTHNPIQVLLHEYIHITKSISGIKGLRAKFKYLFSPPQ